MKGSVTLVLTVIFAAGHRGADPRDPAVGPAARRLPVGRAGWCNPHHTRAARRGARGRSSARVPGVVYRRRSLSLATADVVQVDLSRADIRITVEVASGGVGRAERWPRLIRRLRPTAAITGTYYDVATFLPVGTIVADGVAIYRGSVGTALTFTAENQARLTPCRGAASLPGVQTALHAGPRLLERGRLSLSPAAEGFRDPGIFARKPRAAVGVTRVNKLLLVTVAKPLYLREMAELMRALGASDALCMDGGSSAGLYCAGKSYQVPSRLMTNVLVVYAGPRRLRRQVARSAGQAAPVASRA